MIQEDETLFSYFLKSESVLPQPYSDEKVAAETVELATLEHNLLLLRPPLQLLLQAQIQVQMTFSMVF